MANNRLYLKSKRTGERVLIAKYYPSTGWYAKSAPKDKVVEFFRKHSYGETTYEDTDTHRIKAIGGMYDSASFEVEFEQ